MPNHTPIATLYACDKMVVDGRLMQGYVSIDSLTAYLLLFGFVHNGEVNPRAVERCESNVCRASTGRWNVATPTPSGRHLVPSDQEAGK